MHAAESNSNKIKQQTHVNAPIVNMPAGIKSPNIERNPKDTAPTVTDIRQSLLQKHPSFADMVKGYSSRDVLAK